MKNDNYRDNVNTRYNETKEDRQMKTLHRTKKQISNTYSKDKT